MKMARSVSLSPLLALLLSCARADWSLAAETGSIYDSNLSKSNRNSDEKEDWAWRCDLRIGNNFQLSRNLSLSLGGDVTVAPSGVKELRFSLDLKPNLRAKRAPGLSTGGHR